MIETTASTSVMILSVNDAAKALNVTVSRVNQLINGGQIAAHRLNGRAWAIEQRELAKFQRNRRGRGRPRNG